MAAAWLPGASDGRSAPWRSETLWLDPDGVPAPISLSIALAWLAAPVAAAEPPVVVLWNDPRDYPWEARLREQQGDVGLVLSLTADGEITGCTVTESSEIPSLDSGSCALLTARKWFPPAPTKGGRASGPARQPVLIRWKLRPFANGPIDFGGAWPIEPQSWMRGIKFPKAARRARQDGRAHIAFDITERGRVGNCTIVNSSGSAALDAATCRAYVDRARFVPAGEPGGGPRQTRATSLLKWRLEE